ncbi:hypothetical protein Bca52824_003272 [Brassica carinata]|uniref:NAD(P)-binding domain-containing protein n=1 Tax=Brassica carinata TaxID=52824 RepID=A0A8X8BEK6_BRACI|nr:hypothetical protein Bca52824_003272 [Brassica carinata]
MSRLDDIPSSPGKFKIDKSSYFNRLRFQSSPTKFAFVSFLLLCLISLLFLRSPSSVNPSLSDPSRRSLRTFTYGGPAWEKRIRASARTRTSSNGMTVLVTGAAGFVGTHVSSALKRRGDGVIGIDNFNDYYDPSLKRARQALLERSGVFIVEGDINDVELLRKLFKIVSFTHVMHLAAQAGVRYAMENPSSYVHSNIAGLVNLLEGRLIRRRRVQEPEGRRGPAQLRVFNLGNTSPVPVSDLVSILERQLKVKAKRNVIKMPRNGDVPFTHANISLAQRELGYKPTTDLQTGLKKFVRWYLSYYAGEKKAAAR